jgi:hypothetical protein
LKQQALNPEANPLTLLQDAQAFMRSVAPGDERVDALQDDIAALETQLTAYVAGAGGAVPMAAAVPAPAAEADDAAAQYVVGGGAAAAGSGF